MNKPNAPIQDPACPVRGSASVPGAATPADFCENCGETRQLAKIKGCIRCLRCGFKADCSGM